MKLLLSVFIPAFIFLFGCREPAILNTPAAVIASGQMPALADKNGKDLLMVFGSGDSIMFMHSSDNGLTFSIPLLADTLKDLVDYSMRGPQITATESGYSMIAADESGNIFSYVKVGQSEWERTGRVNDADTVAKEGFLGLGGGGGNSLFAVWLDLRDDKQNKLYGARSTDGGKSWSQNMLVYASPDGAVCDCCKPSVLLKNDTVFVMFRNNVNGNRDLYLTRSDDGGDHFKPAEKLGLGSWKLDACPMDGGGLAIDNKGRLQTVWNRKGYIFSAEPGKAEAQIGEGRSCTLESVNGKNVYAWVEKGQVVVLKPDGIKTTYGKGALPILKSVGDKEILCVWQLDKKIYRTVLVL